MKRNGLAQRVLLGLFCFTLLASPGWAVIKSGPVGLPQGSAWRAGDVRAPSLIKIDLLRPRVSGTDLSLRGSLLTPETAPRVAPTVNPAVASVGIPEPTAVDHPIPVTPLIGQAYEALTVDEGPADASVLAPQFRWTGFFDGADNPFRRSDLPVPASYGPELTSSERVGDPRYAGLIASAKGFLFQGRPAPPADAAALEHKEQRILARIERKEPELHSHLLRVGLLSGLLALRMGLPVAMAERVAWAASLHDIGKIRSDISSVVKQERRLTDAEREVMMEHTTHGARILENTKGLDVQFRLDAAEVARSHHESMDGTGYPEGLKSGEIPLFARVVSVADFIDALLENRPYRAGMPLEMALNVFRKAASRFDPTAYRAMEALIEASLGHSPPESFSDN